MSLAPKAGGRPQKPAHESVCLIGDVGGTNARFALAGADGYRNEQVLQCADFASPELAVKHYLESLSARTPEVICLAAAGPVQSNCVKFTNNSWHLKGPSLKAAFDGAHVRILNDFEAVACSLPLLRQPHLQTVGSPEIPALDQDSFTLGVIGPGTGLGAAGLLRRNGHTFPLITEAGHVSFAPETKLQKAVWELLWQRLGRVSDERLLSGVGLENIRSALAEIQGEPAGPLKVTEIFAEADTCPLAGEAVHLFFQILGQAAGNFALATGAFDGIYIGGGIAQRYEARLAASAFREGFENKGRHRHLMERIPVMLIKHPFPGLLGASAVAREIAG